MSEIYLYTDFYRFTAEEFARNLDKTKGEATVVRLYSSGGNPQAGYTMLAKMAEHGKVTLKVDGYADSMAAFMLCYANGSECLDISTFTFHRAAYPEYVETDAAMLTELANINAFLRKGFENKIDVEKFEESTGTSVDQMFSMDGRIDVTLSAEQAKEVGLIERINPVTDVMLQAISKNQAIEASTLAKRVEIKAEAPKAKAPETEKKQIISKLNKMDINKLRSENLELFNEVVALGVTQERDRVGSFMAFADVDIEAVTKGIVEGGELSRTSMAEFTRKAMSAETVKKIEDDAAPEIVKDEIKAEDEGKDKIEAFLAESRKTYLKTEK